MRIALSAVWRREALPLVRQRILAPTEQAS
jgi:hypothetical protein